MAFDQAFDQIGFQHLQKLEVIMICNENLRSKFGDFSDKVLCDLINRALVTRLNEFLQTRRDIISNLSRILLYLRFRFTLRGLNKRLRLNRHRLLQILTCQPRRRLLEILQLLNLKRQHIAKPLNIVRMILSLQTLIVDNQRLDEMKEQIFQLFFLDFLNFDDTEFICE